MGAGFCFFKVGIGIGFGEIRGVAASRGDDDAEEVSGSMVMVRGVGLDSWRAVMVPSGLPSRRGLAMVGENGLEVYGDLVLVFIVMGDLRPLALCGRAMSPILSSSCRICFRISSESRRSFDM